MADIIKKNMTEIWASDGDVQAPEDSKIRTGWVVEAVPRQWWNWFENRQDTNIAYMLQKGIPEWDAETEYRTNKSYVQRNNIVYKCVSTGINKDPATTPASWVKAFPESTPYLEAIKGLPVTNNSMLFFDNSGVATNSPVASTGLALLATSTAADARSVISAQQANANLSMFASVAPATNLLPYFISSSAMGTTTLTAYGRSLVATADATAARTLLQLGTASTAVVTTSRYDTTAGSVLKVGDFGLGQTTASPVADANLVTASGFYSINSSTLNTPGPASSGATLLHTTWDVNTNQQIIMQANRMWQRQGGSGGWGAWVESWNSNNLVKTSSSTDTTTGRMLKVGDFGLGQQGVVVTDINALSNTGTGFYRLTSPYTGSPVAGASCTVIHQSLDNERTQIATLEGSSTVRTFIRKYSDSTSDWGTWVELYHSGNSAVLVSQVQANIQPQLDAKQSSLGFTPVQQGTGAGQSSNQLKIGWSSVGRLRLTVDNTDLADVWPININGSATSANSAATAAKWTTARAITVAGGVTGTAYIDGSSDIVLNATVTNNSHTHEMSTINGLSAALSNFPTRDSISATGLASNDPTSPYMRQSSTGNVIPLANKDYVFGYNQAWYDVTSSRAAGSSYTNSTNKPIMVSATSTVAQSGSIIGYVNGAEIAYQTFNNMVAGGRFTITWIVGPGSTYQVNVVGLGISRWVEWR